MNIYKWRFRSFAIFSFLAGLGITFFSWPDAIGGAITIRWAWGLIVLPLFAFIGQPKSVQFWLLAFTLWAIFCVLKAPFAPEAIYSASYWAIIYIGVLSGQVARIDLISRGAALGLIPSVVFGAAYYLGVPHWDCAAYPCGTFVNKNILGEICVLVLVGGLLADRRYWWVYLIPLAGALLSQSRSVAICLCILVPWVLFRMGHHRFAACICFVAAAFLGYSISTRGFETLGHRGRIWLDTINAVTWTGAGTGSFRVNFPSFAVAESTLRERPDHAHNDFLEIAYEQGLIGMALIAPFIFGLVRKSKEYGGVFVASLMVLCLLNFPLHLPATALYAALFIGHILSYRPMGRDDQHPG